MSYNMRQVTKEQFEMLTIFHPGEIRYYVDIGTVVNKGRGAKISVKRTPRSGASSKKSPKREVKYIQVTVKGAGNMRPDSLQYSVYSAATRALANDPTKVLSRKALTDALAKALPSVDRSSQIVPAISALIKLGNLRYTGEPVAAS